jgi:hypothetical protein
MPQIKLCHLCLSTALGFGGLFAASAHGFAAGAPAAQAAATASNRILGTVTAATAASVTVHTASNGDVTVALTPQTRLLRANPGEKSLKDAAIITAADLATGDRAVILLAAGAAFSRPMRGRPPTGGRMESPESPRRWIRPPGRSL